MNANEIMVRYAALAAKTIAVVVIILALFTAYAMFFASEDYTPRSEMSPHPTYITPPPTP